MIKNIVNWFLEILFPSRCIGCQKSQSIICDTCIANLKYAERETENDIFAIYDYRDPVIKQAIWKLKYHHTPYIGKILGELIFLNFIEKISEIKIFSLGSPIYVIPVPISHDRMRNRGYNQSEIIAKSFCSVGGKNNFKFKNKIINKKLETMAQAKITNRTKRLKNLKNAFEIKNRNEIKGKTIIVIDDVTTTGATLSEIIKILKKSGAKKVLGFAIAH